jgi:hypothetical protein
MTGLFTRTRPKEIAPNKARIIGTARGSRYYDVDGTEHIEVGRVASLDEARPGELLMRVTQRAYDDQGGSIATGLTYTRLAPVEAGTYQRERDRRRIRSTEHPRLADALDLPALAARAPLIVAGPSRSVPLMSGSPIAPKGSGSFAAGRPAIRGRDLLPFLESRGVTLKVPGDRLLVESTGHLAADVREVIERGGRLLLALVTGKPALCELRHSGQPDEAWTVAVGGALACHGHATGELKA